MAAAPESAGTGKGLIGWIDERFPLTKLWKEQVAEYYAPKNFNFWYFFGALSLVVLANQLVTGIFLTMSYKPSSAEAFASVEYIMRDVEWGWLIRYMHSTGASAFFIVVYLHMFRALLYGSHRKPRELVWIFGCLIYVLLMAEAFMGYVLPWGNMSYWGAQVIVSLFSSLPIIGGTLVEWIRGDYNIADPTLNRSSRCTWRHCRWRWCSWWWRTSWRCTRWGPTTPTASTSRNIRTTRVIPSTASLSIPTTR